MDSPAMKKIVSRDGTPIAFHRSGAGPPLLLVAGTGAANPMAWTESVALLARACTVYALDRRGRGDSGDHPDYSLEREAEDIAAVAGEIGGPVNVLGHSFGGLCALAAAPITPNLRKLILYEPYIPRQGASPYTPGMIERLEAQLAAGDREGVLLTHYREIAKLSLQEIEQITASPYWPARLATAHTIPREMRVEEHSPFDPRRFATLPVPVLLVVGGDSPPELTSSQDVLRAALPQVQVAVLPGQQHIAMYTAPELFARTVLDFLGAG